MILVDSLRKRTDADDIVSMKFSQESKSIIPPSLPSKSDTVPMVGELGVSMRHKPVPPSSSVNVASLSVASDFDGGWGKSGWGKPTVAPGLLSATVSQ